jgi:hypothetical protein
MESLTPEQAAKLPEMDFYADKGRDLGMQVDNLRTDKPTLDTSKPAPEALKATLESEPGRLFSDENLAEVQKGKEIEEAYAQRDAQALAERGEAPPVRSRVDEPLMEPSQGIRPMEKITKPISSRGAMGRQRGAVNFGKGEDFAKRLQILKENTLFLKRGEEHFTPGTQVRLMNGKVGIIQNVSEGRYQIKGLDGTPMDSVPVQGIDYAYKPETGGLSEGFLKAARKKEGGAGGHADRGNHVSHRGDRAQ